MGEPAHHSDRGRSDGSKSYSPGKRASREPPCHHGVGFQIRIRERLESKKWFKDMKRGTGNILPNKIQVHELPAFFTLCGREDALTRPQVNRYLELEEVVRMIPSFQYLPSRSRRRLLCILVEKFKVETDWKEQCLEVKHREVRTLMNSELKRVLALVRWSGLRAYVKSGIFQR